MRSLIRVLVVLSLLGGGAQTAFANLIVNGGFEAQDVNRGGWAWFTSDAVDGWSGSNIEIWDHYGGFAPFEGNQHAELNAHPSHGGAFTIFQSFDTEIGQDYQVSFAYAARSNTDEAFQFDLFSDRDVVFSQMFTDHLVRQWSSFTTRFTAIDTSTTLSFTSVTPLTHTVGNFLDAVSVIGIPAGPDGRVAVSEPWSMALILTGLVLMMRRRSKNSVSQ